MAGALSSGMLKMMNAAIALEPETRAWEVLTSSQDQSVNFVADTADGGAIECRYVRRIEDYFIVYLSSHTGCRQACRFCHLTQTGQTMMTPVDLQGFLAQGERVFEHYDRVARPARTVNFNFMARGEALLNPIVMRNWAALGAGLTDLAAARGLEPIFNVSTILPVESADLDLGSALADPRIGIYYSLYSLNPEFRKRWLPRAMDPKHGLERIAGWQAKSGGRVALHWALIAGENDSPEDAASIVELVKASGVKAKFNLVRYNSPEGSNSRESDEARITAYFDVMREGLNDPESRIVPRVGFDVKASCGMFVS